MFGCPKFLRFVNSQLVSLPPVGIFNMFLLLFNICLLISVSSISTVVLNTCDLFIYFNELLQPLKNVFHVNKFWTETFCLMLFFRFYW